MRLTLPVIATLLVPPVILAPTQRLLRSVGDVVAGWRLRSHSKLHLACGRNQMPGWANIDLHGPVGVIKLNLTRPLPVASNSKSFVYCEHFIEHIERPAALRLMTECHRALKPGGVLRVSTPDLRRLIDEYGAGRLDYWADMNWTPGSPAQLLNEGMRLWGHQFVFDAQELIALFKAAGFSRIEPVAWRESTHRELAGLECRPLHGELIYECTK